MNPKCHPVDSLAASTKGYKPQKNGDGTFALRAINQIVDAPVRASALAAVAVSLAAGE